MEYKKLKWSPRPAPNDREITAGTYFGRYIIYLTWSSDRERVIGAEGIFTPDCFNRWSYKVASANSLEVVIQACQLDHERILRAVLVEHLDFTTLVHDAEQGLVDEEHIYDGCGGNTTDAFHMGRGDGLVLQAKMVLDGLGLHYKNA